MTTRNNFDKSSTGTDITCTVFFDTDSSQRDFRENFESVQSDGYRTTSIQYYIDNGNVEGKDSVKFTVKGAREKKIEYLEKESSFEREEIETWDEDTMDSEIIGYHKDINLIGYAMDKGCRKQL